jgi:hypothetical protein
MSPWRFAPTLLPRRPALAMTVALQSDHPNMDHSAAVLLRWRESTAVSGPRWPHAIRCIPVRLRRGAAASRDRRAVPLARPPRPRINRWIAVQSIRKKSAALEAPFGAIRAPGKPEGDVQRRDPCSARSRLVTKTNLLAKPVLSESHPAQPAEIAACLRFRREATCSRLVAFRGKIKVHRG